MKVKYIEKPLFENVIFEDGFNFRRYSEYHWTTINGNYILEELLLKLEKAYQKHLNKI